LLDIVVANFDSENQLIMNRGGVFDEALPLPGGIESTRSISLGDVDNDGLLDIVVANFGTENQLIMNRGGGVFDEALALPGGSEDTVSISLGDVDNDGLLDIVVGNVGSQNQVILYSSCPGGGAQLHSKSWCFKCPSFMGLYSSHSNFCQECIPDYLQQAGNGELCELPCVSLSERKFGTSTCSRCPSGTFYDNSLSRSISNTTSWEQQRCVECLPGYYSNDKIVAVNNCFSCSPGEYQPYTNSSKCMKCPVGEYQPNFGQSACLACAVGGYCNVTKSNNGGFTPCPAGTFNDQKGTSNDSACMKCPVGTYSIESGASSRDACLPCPPGTFSNKFGENITRC
jgi:hypothetical protein